MVCHPYQNITIDGWQRLLKISQDSGAYAVDNVIIYDKDIESHRDYVQQFLQRCQE